MTSNELEVVQRICFCHGVDEEQIRKAIRAGADTLQKVQEATLASTGCGGCQPEVERLLAEELEKAAAPLRKP